MGGYYRKRFDLAWAPGQRVYLRFDGVYMNADTWVNGVHLGWHPYGYLGSLSTSNY
jgi:beta-galactosidase